MFSRHFIFAALLGAALIGPAVYYNDAWWLTDRDSSPPAGTLANVAIPGAGWTGLGPATLADSAATPTSIAGIETGFNPARDAGSLSPPPLPIESDVILPGNEFGPDQNAIPLEFMPITNLAEIFRFDVKPDWVSQRWQRVSNSAGGPGLAGMRVPLVTGVNSDDLFGSLTYFFDANQQLQQITFRGWSGNPTGLVNLMTSRYGLKNQPTTGASLYVAGDSDEQKGILYLQQPNVVSSNNPSQRYAILLELNNPAGPTTLSQQATSLLSSLF